MVLQHLVQRQQSDKRTQLESLLETLPMTGLSGRLAFNPKGTNNPMHIRTVPAILISYNTVG